MQFIKSGRWWLSGVLAVCVLPLVALTPGCRGSRHGEGPFPPSGGPVVPPGATPTNTPTRTPTGTPTATPGFPGGTPFPTATPTTRANQLAGGYTGTFSLPAINETDRTFTLRITNTGAATGTMTLADRTVINLTGDLEILTGNLTLSGTGPNGQGGQFTYNVTGNLIINPTGTITGTGTIQRSDAINGTWQANKTS